MIALEFRTAVLCLAAAASLSLPAAVSQDRGVPRAQVSEQEAMVQIYYLEFVTPAMDETCDLLAKQHGVTFGDPVEALGNARTAKLSDGGRIGVRKPMHETEEPVTRPYLRVKDIDAAFAAAEAAGAQIMMAPTESPEGGRFAIYMHGEIQHGIWQP